MGCAVQCRKAAPAWCLHGGAVLLHGAASPSRGYRIVFGMGVCRAGSRVLNEVFWFPLVRLEGNEKETQAGLCAAPRAAAASVRNTSGIWWESPPVKLQVSHTNWRLVKV